jgi:prevent-host-death family protein
MKKTAIEATGPGTHALEALLRRVERGGGRIVVRSRGKPRAALVSLDQYARLQAFERSPHADIIARLLAAPPVARRLKPR